MLLNLKLIAASILIAGSIGFGSGAWVTYKYFRVSQLEADKKKLVQDRNRLTTAIGVGEKLDDEDQVVELSNEEIDRALRKKLTPSKPDDYVCVSADSMRDIRSFR